MEKKEIEFINGQYAENGLVKIYKSREEAEAGMRNVSDAGVEIYINKILPTVYTLTTDNPLAF